MIRNALIALGLSAGAASAQGMVPTAPLLETCGGTRFTLQSVIEDSMVGRDPATWGAAADVVSARLGSLYGEVFDYTDFEIGPVSEITISMPAGIEFDREAIEKTLEYVSFGFHDVIETRDTNEGAPVKAGQALLPHAEEPFSYFVVSYPEFIGADAFEQVQAVTGYDGYPVLQFRFTPAASALFADYSGRNIGNAFAIVVNDQVVSAPIIQDRISGGTGIITGSFTEGEARMLAALLQGGQLSFDLFLAVETHVDGSDPSADFCP